MDTEYATSYEGCQASGRCFLIFHTALAVPAGFAGTWGNYFGLVVNNSATNSPPTGNVFFRLKQ